MAVVRSCSCIPPERTDGSLCFLDLFTLFPPSTLHPLGVEGVFVYTRSMGVLSFLCLLPQGPSNFISGVFGLQGWAGQLRAACFTYFSLSPRGSDINHGDLSLLLLLLQPLPIASRPGQVSVGVVGPLLLSWLITSRKIIDAS